MKTTEKQSTHLSMPFAEFSKSYSTNTSVVNRFTPELGRTRSLMESFQAEYQGFFGDAEFSSGAIKVHTPEGEERSTTFAGSDKNFSADFVVQNQVDERTSFEEMQNYMGILNGLSEGRLRIRCQEALLQGKLHDGDLSNDPNAIMRLFEQGSEYGEPQRIYTSGLGSKDFDVFSAKT